MKQTGHRGFTVVEMLCASAISVVVVTGMVASSGRLESLRRLLHSDYTATLIFNDPVIGAVHRLTRAPGR